MTLGIETFADWIDQAIQQMTQNIEHNQHDLLMVTNFEGQLYGLIEARKQHRYYLNIADHKRSAQDIYNRMFSGELSAREAGSIIDHELHKARDEQQLVASNGRWATNQHMSWMED